MHSCFRCHHKRAVCVLTSTIFHLFKELWMWAKTQDKEETVVREKRQPWSVLRENNNQRMPLCIWSKKVPPGLHCYVLHVFFHIRKLIEPSGYPELPKPHPIFFHPATAVNIRKHEWLLTGSVCVCSGCRHVCCCWGAWARVIGKVLCLACSWGPSGCRSTALPHCVILT